MSRTILALAVALGFTLTGCNEFDVLKTETKLKGSARDAWDRYEHQYDGMVYEDEFEDGFKTGYLQYVYTGCPELPPEPPSKYRKACYQTCFGKQAIRAFYEGGQLGVSAAMEDCSGMHLRRKKHG